MARVAAVAEVSMRARLAGMYLSEDRQVQKDDRQGPVSVLEFGVDQVDRK